MTTIALKLNAARKLNAAAPARVIWGTRHSLTQMLELAGVLTLMGSSAACAAFTLAHLG